VRVPIFPLRGRPPNIDFGFFAPGSGSRKNSISGTSRRSATLSTKSNVALPFLAFKLADIGAILPGVSREPFLRYPVPNPDAPEIPCKKCAPLHGARRTR